MKNEWKEFDTLREVSEENENVESDYKRWNEMRKE